MQCHGLRLPLKQFLPKASCAFSGLITKPKPNNRKHKMKHLIKSIAAVALLSLAGYAGDLVNVSGASKAAVNGYDTVAFFTDGKPVNGSPFITAEYQGATYFFANEEHKALFAAGPEKYAPQFGGFCAFGVGLGKLFPVDVNTWQVREGKLYLNLNGDILKKFNADFAGNAAKADKNWPDLVKKHGRASDSAALDLKATTWPGLLGSNRR